MPTLDWIGKDAVVKHHKDVPYRLLEPVPGLSCGRDTDSGNLIVQGDNLHALKALLPRYAGQVKCIYIDPPYNTGNEGWVYNDNVNSPTIHKWLHETVGREGEDLSRHDKWLCMMYPRLVLLKQFLREDGAIFVSIDDSEVASLRLLMDEIFGSSSFLANLIWQHSVQPKGYSGIISLHHNHLLAYSISDSFIFRDLPRQEKHNTHYSNPDDDPRGPWRAGDVRNALYRPNLIYDLETPSGQKIAPPQKGWRWSKETMARKIASEEIVFSADETRITRKIFLKDQTGRAPESLWFGEDCGTTRQANSQLKDIFGDTSQFDTPKPYELIQRILQIATEEDSLILDSFAGSGTTAHAVMKQNAEDGGNRRFILVEMEEDIARNVTAERVRRVAEGYTDAKGKPVEGLGGGFQYCKLSKQPLFAADGAVREDVGFAQLAEFVWFAETGSGFAGAADSPLIGVDADNRAVYLLYNGILKDKSVNGGNVLTSKTLAALPPHDGPKVIYAAACRLGRKRLDAQGIVFKQTPYALEF